jgi:ATP-dependent Lon protease
VSKSSLKKSAEWNFMMSMSSVRDIPSIPGELFAKFQTSFYSDPVDAVYKALGVE